MDEAALRQMIQALGRKPLAERKALYTPTAAAYHRVRPQYPAALLDQALEAAHLAPPQRVLEVGCGPGTATLAFAQRGFSLVALEPNPAFYRLAVEHCRPYPEVHLENLAFEEWDGEAADFDVVLGASSFHWIPQEMVYPKAAQVLKPNGCLLLLWNKELQPSFPVFQTLQPLYAAYAPHVARWEDPETQRGILHHLGQLPLESGHFRGGPAGQLVTTVIYTSTQYIELLTPPSSRAGLPHCPSPSPASPD